MAELELEHVDKVFPNGVQALTDLCLGVHEGELVVLAGPSGCGKTTTLRLIAGLEQPTRGVIRLGGQVVNGLPPRARDVALVFQRPALYPHWNVRRNLASGLALRRSVNLFRRWLLRGFLPKRWGELRQHERRLADQVAETARLLGLEHLLDRRPGQLSGGEQQRVALGRALVRRPSLLLLDEPLSNLDASHRTDLRRELHLLQRRVPATMIYVTHDQVEALTLADRLVILDRGKIQQVDSPAAVYDRPANRMVAGFVGWPSINFLEGCLVPDKNQLSFVTGDWSLPVPPEVASVWSPFRGKSVTLGIRPEDIVLASLEDMRRKPVMEVVLVESLGRACLVTLRRQGCQMVAMQPERQGLAAEQRVAIHMHLERAHLFDGVHGRALYNNRPAG
ncbi:MAG: ABC transporter ATP-binding protein [Gemmataceae bacterium]|nr:ABC transporter ATP-binding protein [Gemmataceae bacterium]